MKKLIVTIAIVLGIGMTTFAQEAYTGGDEVVESGLFSFGLRLFSNGELGLFPTDSYENEEEYMVYDDPPQSYGGYGLFGRGEGSLFANTNRNNFGLMLPSAHSETGDANAPLGSGIVVLIGLGAAYALGKKRKED